MLNKKGIDYFTGVPDSLLRGLCDFLTRTVGIDPKRHVIAHNEGGCAALAAGYHLASGKVPCVYLQNSGIGNIANPAASLLHPKVYGIPVLFVVGWRGEPGVKDEPQHVYQGEMTENMLDSLDIKCFVMDKETSEEQLHEALFEFADLFEQGKSCAIIIRKGGLTGVKSSYVNNYELSREYVIEKISETAKNDILVSTTGKISRELFETRKKRSEGHEKDFLTVGSMGHSAMIAFGIANEKTQRRVWCIDGDGAVLMHMGALAVIGHFKPSNFVHIVLNNAAHESVGGAPTVAQTADFAAAAKTFGYEATFSVSNNEELENALMQLTDTRYPVMLEIKVSLCSRDDLGRPSTTPKENKDALMKYLKGKPV